MPASAFCHKFLRESLASTHQYRRYALTDMTISLTRGASLNLTSIGRSRAGHELLILHGSTILNIHGI